MVQRSDLCIYLTVQVYPVLDEGQGYSCSYLIFRNFLPESRIHISAAEDPLCLRFADEDVVSLNRGTDGNYPSYFSAIRVQTRSNPCRLIHFVSLILLCDVKMSLIPWRPVPPTLTLGLREPADVCAFFCPEPTLDLRRKINFTYR